MIAFQRNTNLFAAEEDMTSSDWVKDLLVNSSEAALSQRLDKEFQQFEPIKQWGITYLKFLYEMFFMTNGVVTAFKLFLKAFADEGLTKTVGENVSEASVQVKAVSERLSDVNQLPLEAPTYVLQGLTNCSIPEFNGPFDMTLNKELVTQMGTDVSLVNTSSVTLKRVLKIIVLENNSYHYLNTSNVWNVPQVKRGHHTSHQPHHNPECFNCGEAHLLPDCKRARDEAKIARNRKAYMDKRPDGFRYNGRKKWSTGGHGGRGGRGGGNPDRSAAYGVQLMGNKCM